MRLFLERPPKPSCDNCGKRTRRFIPVLLGSQPAVVSDPPGYRFWRWCEECVKEKFPR